MLKVSIMYYTYKMNNDKNLLEDYVNFVDNTKKQNKYFKKFLLLIAINMLFLFFLLFKFLKWITVSLYNKYLEQVILTLI